MANPVVLVVDDDKSIRRIVRAALEPQGFDVITVNGAEEAIEELHKSVPQLIVLDLVLCGASGLDVCRHVREFSSVPIIVLSVKSDEADKVEALDMGADDYLIKPFGMDELLARIRAVLRRSLASEADNAPVSIGELSVDLAQRRVMSSGVEIKLTPKEFDILRYLIAKRGSVVTHRQLLQAVWGSEYVDQTEYVRIFINQLRRKIEPDPHKPRYIITEPWVGYRLASD